jgi:hypothetical protein
VPARSCSVLRFCLGTPITSSQQLDEASELVGVAEGRAVAEAHEPWPEGRDPPGGGPVLGRVKGEAPGHGVLVGEHVAEDEHAVVGAPEGAMARGMPRRLQHNPGPEPVALAEMRGHGVGRAADEVAEEVVAR